MLELMRPVQVEWDSNDDDISSAYTNTVSNIKLWIKVYIPFFLLNEQFKRFLYNVVACFTFMSYISLSKIYVYDIVLCYWRYTRRTLLRLICTLTQIVVDIKRIIQTYVHYENEKNKTGYMFRPLLGITDLICLLK